MRILNRAHVSWFIFVVLATIVACCLYIGNFHPQSPSAGFRLPPALLQKQSQLHSVGGTPLGLIFGATAFAIFIFLALFSVRKKVVLWRVGTLQRWMRAHIWLGLLTIPLVILHSGFRLGGPMTTMLMALYMIVTVSGIYGLVLQHQMPHIMKEWLPAETVFEQIPYIRSQLSLAAEKMRDSFELVPEKKTDAGVLAPSMAKAALSGSAPMASTVAELSTPTARAKTVVGSAIIAASIRPVTTTAAGEAKAQGAAPATNISNVAGEPASTPQAIGAPAAHLPSETQVASVPGAGGAAVKSVAPVADPESEAALITFLEQQVMPYLSAKRAEKFPLGGSRFSDDTFRFLRLCVAEGYHRHVEEIQAWCDERRMLDLQTRLYHWLHGWLFVHVPFSFLLLMFTAWHAFVSLFYY